MSHPPLLGLLARREFRNLSQKDMGAVIGVTQSQYAKFEQGKVRLDIYRADMLARYLECEIGGLL